MTPPRPKQEYEEREPDSTGTPLQRFERALKKVISTPKGNINKPASEPKKRASA
jgi:hypothetical protein